MNQISLSELSSSSLFKGIAAKEIEYLSSLFSVIKVQKGKTVFVENMPGESLYLIRQGTVQISQMLAEVDEQVLMTLAAGDIFGELAVIDKGNRSATARVSKDAILFSLSQKDFSTLANQKPSLGLQLTLNIVRVFSSRIRSAKKDYRAMLTASLSR